MMRRQILIVDDDEDLCQMLARLLEREGFRTYVQHEATAAIQWLADFTPVAVLMDVRLPGMNGLEAIRQIRRKQPDLPIIVISAYAGVLDAVAALKAGACDYLPKPFDNMQVVKLVRLALKSRQNQLLEEVSFSGNKESDGSDLVAEMGPSVQVGCLSSELSRVASTDYSVVIQGETGTGKELVARFVHANSFRREGPFVAVDCGAVTESLLENELFGHEKGAYTGADRQQSGRFESASGGTLFLDEISNLSFKAQGMLLRVLQERVIHRLGGNKDIPVDVRVVAASNQNLAEAVKEGEFREDLLYRLNDFSVCLPALRQRQSDILYLAKRFLQEGNRELRKSVSGFTQAAESTLLEAPWPGNVRQLRSVVRRALLKVDTMIDVADLQPLEPESVVDSETSVVASFGIASSEQLMAELQRRPLKDIVSDYSDRLEAVILTQVLDQTGGNKAEAARLLRIDYKTIHCKLKRLGIPAMKSPMTN